MVAINRYVQRVKNGSNNTNQTPLMLEKEFITQVYCQVYCAYHLIMFLKLRLIHKKNQTGYRKVAKVTTFIEINTMD